jgi:hypothetical protein
MRKAILQTLALALLFFGHAQLLVSLAPATLQNGTDAIVPYVPPDPSKGNELKPCPLIDADHPDRAGIYKIGKEVSAPMPKNKIDARMTREARAYADEHGGTFSGSSLIGLVVDQQGNPQEICLKRVAGFGLDEEAARAVSQYRFSPAKMHKSPVAVRLVVEVKFESY